jgi:GT2 family glycosyltransferase
VVDDCSSDNTSEAIKELNDNRIRYIRLEKNSGGSMTPRKIGIEQSTSKYIAILDDDDFWADDNKLKDQVAYLESHPNCVLVGTDAVSTNGGDEIMMYHHYPKTNLEIRNKILLYNCFYHSSVMYRREILDKVGGYKTIKGGRYQNYSNDYDLWLRMGMVGEIANLPIYGVAHVYSPAQLSTIDRIFYMIKQMKLISNYKREYPNYLIANAVRAFCSVAELPVLRSIKNAIIK